MKEINTIHNSSMINLGKLRNWNLLDLQAELINQETLKVAQEEKEKIKENFFFLLILLLIIAPIALILWQKWNIWLLAPIYFFYLIIFFPLKSGSLKPSEIQVIHTFSRRIDRNRYDPEYYNMLKKWEALRSAEESKRLAEEKEQKNLERIERERLEEEERAERQREGAEEMAIKKQLAEEADAEGKDVCMKCYTINPERCYCGNCTTCYGGSYRECGSCESSDSGDDD